MNDSRTTVMQGWVNFHEKLFNKNYLVSVLSVEESVTLA